jgi:ferredoxin
VASERSGTVRVHPDGVVVAARRDECILTALNRSGYGYRIGCRRGGCGICKADLVQGAVSYPTTVSDEVLTREEIDAGICLPCRAVPLGDVTIRLRDDRLRCTSTLLASLAAREIERDT